MKMQVTARVETEPMRDIRCSPSPDCSCVQTADLQAKKEEIVKARDGGARDSRMGNNTGDLTWFGRCTRRSVMEPLARVRRYHRGQATRGRSTCDAARHTWCWATAAEETLTGRLVGGRMWAAAGNPRHRHNLDRRGRFRSHQAFLPTGSCSPP